MMKHDGRLPLPEKRRRTREELIADAAEALLQIVLRRRRDLAALRREYGQPDAKPGQPDAEPTGEGSRGS